MGRLMFAGVGIALCVALNGWMGAARSLDAAKAQIDGLQLQLQEARAHQVIDMTAGPYDWLAVTLLCPEVAPRILR